MSYTPQLQDREYYENRYDRLIVTQCRMTEEVFESWIEKELADNKKGKPEAQVRHEHTWMKNYYLYFKKWSLAEKREETIAKWIKDDRERDEFYERTNPSKYPYCFNCNIEMQVILKEAFFAHDKKERHRIFFMFECKNCKSRRGFYNDWEELRSEKKVCEKCGSDDIDSKFIKWEKNDIFRDTCKACSHIKDELFEHYHKEEDLNFARDREKYVLTEKELATYKDGIWRLGELQKLFKDIDARKAREAQWWEAKEENVIIEKKILDVADMKDLVIKELQKTEIQGHYILYSYCSQEMSNYRINAIREGNW